MQKLIIHEYYYAFFYTFILFAIIALFLHLKNFEQQQLIKFVVIVFLVINVFYCKYYIIEKQQAQRIDKILFSKAFQEYLNNNDCDDFKTVFCFDDISLNQQLYAIKRKGFTQYNDWKK
jgi:c-di-AMP phosphodiesterase-like protein